jgi:hypothetical protein
MATTAKKQPAAKTGTAVIDVQAEMAKEMESISSRIQANTGNSIRVTQDKQFQLPDGTKNPGPLSVVILDFASVNEFHDRPYKKGEEMPPACFAVGLEPNNLVPHETSPDKQADDCRTCANNEWGSNGAGKACSNTRLLAVCLPDADADEILTLKVSPTGVKAFDAYVSSVKSQFSKPPIGVITEIYFDPNLTYGSLRFKPAGLNENVGPHFELKKQARDRVLAPKDVSKYQPPAPVRGGPRKK